VQPAANAATPAESACVLQPLPQLLWLRGLSVPSHNKGNTVFLYQKPFLEHVFFVLQIKTVPPVQKQNSRRRVHQRQRCVCWTGSAAENVGGLVLAYIQVKWGDDGDMNCVSTGTMLPVLLFLACAIGAVAFGVNPYYYKHWCNNPCCPLPLTYDTHCAKMFPSYPSRDFKCASSWTPDRLVGFTPDAPLSALAVNSTFFDGVIGADLIDVAAVIVRRDASGAAWFKYVGNRFYGRSSETWSSSKVFVAAFAASALRSHCSMGLDSRVIDAESCYAVGDLLTVIATYDSTLGFSSNSLAGNTPPLPDPHLQLSSLNPPPPFSPLTHSVHGHAFRRRRPVCCNQGAVAFGYKHIRRPRRKV